MKRLTALLLAALLFSAAACSSPPCEEDQPCWDCHTMGNQICG